MKIKLNIDPTKAGSPEARANLSLIADALIATNGNARTHTFGVQDILGEARMAEDRLIELGFANADRRGARLEAESGDKLPNAYKYQATTNCITLVRGSTHWYLTSLSRGGLWPNRQPTSDLILTVKQDALAVQKYRTGLAPTGRSRRWYRSLLPEMQASDLSATGAA